MAPADDVRKLLGLNCVTLLVTACTYKSDWLREGAVSSFASKVLQVATCKIGDKLSIFASKIFFVDKPSLLSQ